MAQSSHVPPELRSRLADADVDYKRIEPVGSADGVVIMGHLGRVDRSDLDKAGIQLGLVTADGEYNVRAYMTVRDE